MTPSPLVDRVGHVAGAMAEFAAQYMAQTDGTHDVAYWAEQVEWANGNSRPGRVRRRLLDRFASQLPANWAAVFAPLFSSGNEVPSKE